MKNYKKITLITLFLSILSSCNVQTQNTIVLPAQNVEVETQKNTKSTVHGIFTANVTEKLPDDTQGLKHQLFMIKIKSGKFNGYIVKVAHDIDYAPYVPVEIGSELELKGDLITDAKPDMVLHWTHHSTDNSHPDGYIKLKDQVYK